MFKQHLHSLDSDKLIRYILVFHEEVNPYAIGVRGMVEIYSLIMVGILILMTAFFVAAEFAIVRMRKSRVDYLVEQGTKGANAVKKVTENLDEYLAACQLGITVTALGIGWLGEPAVKQLLQPIFDQFSLSNTIASTLSFITAFSIITFFHVVLGELAPKSLSIQKTEVVSLLVSPVLILFDKIMYPFIWILNGSARLLVRLLGLSPSSESEEAHSEEELRLILSNSYKSGEINASEMNFVNKVFEFDERVAKEVMVPRTEMICVFTDNTYEENFDIIKKGKYTRYPVADDDKDHIIGFINIKDLFNSMINQEENNFHDYFRPIIHVVENTPVNELLVRMQKQRSHMAIVFDEYGGTAGLVTVEDILEEIVGEIRDEFDNDESPMIQEIDEDTILLDGKVLIAEINELLGTTIDEEKLDTIGGWILSEQVEQTKQGTMVKHDGYCFTVREIEGHQVKLVEAKRIDKRSEPSDSDPS